MMTACGSSDGQDHSFHYRPNYCKSSGCVTGSTACGELGFKRAVFEGDSLIVVSALQQNSSCWLVYGQLLDDIKTKLNSFPFHDVQHIRWDANIVTHRIANVALSQSLDQVWIEECPFIQSIVLAEQDFPID
jgi:hypothetical protein